MCSWGTGYCSRPSKYSGGDTLLTYEAAEAVAQSLGLKLDVQHQEPDYRHAMANWNNAGERTGQEVIDAYAFDGQPN